VPYQQATTFIVAVQPSRIALSTSISLHTARLTTSSPHKEGARLSTSFSRAHHLPCIWVWCFPSALVVASEEDSSSSLAHVQSARLPHKSGRVTRLPTRHDRVCARLASRTANLFKISPHPASGPTYPQSFSTHLPTLKPSSNIAHATVPSNLGVAIRDA
jgi:hypothetical protein